MAAWEAVLSAAPSGSSPASGAALALLASLFAGAALLLDAYADELLSCRAVMPLLQAAVTHLPSRVPEVACAASLLVGLFAHSDALASLYGRITLCALRGPLQSPEEARRPSARTTRVARVTARGPRALRCRRRLRRWGACCGCSSGRTRRALVRWTFPCWRTAAPAWARGCGACAARRPVRCPLWHWPSMWPRLPHLRQRRSRRRPPQRRRSTRCAS